MKNKKSIIALLIVAIIGIVGLTVAYFSNTDTIENEFNTKEYANTYTEEFVSPDNWLPGDETNKTIVVANTGDVDQAVRIRVSEAWTTHNNGTLNGWIHPDGTKSNHTTETELSTDESVAIINFANQDDWTKVTENGTDYYYYNFKLAPGQSTSSFIESVTFNAKTKLDDTCETEEENGVKTVTCNSSGDDYDNATYKLTFTIETVQYNRYNEAWGTSANIAAVKSLTVRQFVAKKTNPSGTEYNSETKGNMFALSHNDITDYRYIGDAPNNNVKFNCDSDGTNCETWKIMGVFNVDDGTGNVEQRIKIIRGNSFANELAWNSDSNNDWTNASLKNFLNGEYYNATGDAETYGLKESARNMIADAKYYLGGIPYNSTTNYGSVEEIYALERGNTLCAACNSDTSKLTWTGKVALMYPSDQYMVYGNGVNATCYDNPNGCHGTDAKTGWVYNSNIRDGNVMVYSGWLLSSSSSDASSSLINRNDGFLDEGGVIRNSGIRPVVYLKSNIRIVEGTGEVGNEYTLLMN